MRHAASFPDMDNKMEIKLMQARHWPKIKRIYLEGILTGNATFEKTPPRTWQEWAKKHVAKCSLVAMSGKRVMRWTALSPISSRTVYAGVAEASIYVRTGFSRLTLGFRKLFVHNAGKIYNPGLFPGGIRGRFGMALAGKGGTGDCPFPQKPHRSGHIPERAPPA